jgi:CHAT domain-containing protein
MRAFYAAIEQRHATAIEAVRAAQIHMLKISEWSDPRYWGAFFIEGDWR